MPMNCEEAFLAMADGSAGLLSLEQQRALDAHLSQCAGCSVEARRFAFLLRSLDALPSPKPPPDLWQGVRAGVALEEAAREVVPLAVPPRRSSGLEWVPAVFTGFAGMAVALGLLAVGGRPASVSAMGLAGSPVLATVARHNAVDLSTPTLDATSVIVLDSLPLRAPLPAPSAQPARPGSSRESAP